MRLLSTGWLKHHRPAFDRARSVTTRAQSFSISDGVVRKTGPACFLMKIYSEVQLFRP
jgi:hypothetical protein